MSAANPLSLRDALASWAAQLRPVMPPGAWLKEDAVARLGIACVDQPLPKRFKPGTIKQCFSNTARLVARNRSLTYCEGFVRRASLPIPIHHAWAIDIHRNVIDVTLRRIGDEANEYVGIAVPADEYARYALAVGSQSVLVDAIERVNVPFILARCPELAPLIETARERRL